MRIIQFVLTLGLAGLVFASAAQADFLVYHIGGKPGGGGSRGGAGAMPAGGRHGMPGFGGGTMGPPQASTNSGSNRRIILQGKVTVNQGKTVTYEHPTFKDDLYFSLDDVTIYRAPTTLDEYRKVLGKAGNDPDAIMKAAVFALKKGLLKEFYAAVDRVLKLDPNHEAARKIKELKKQFDEPIPEDPKTEKELRSVVRRSNMKVKLSNHYILLHDTPEKPRPGHTKNRAQERIELLEQVYEGFLLLFHAQDVELDIPKERLKVVLFNDEKDYLEYATSLSPALASALGFWSPINNVAVFYDQGTGEDFAWIEEQLGQLRKQADEAKKKGTGKDLIRLTRTLELMLNVDKENADIKTVSHECTHQMAGNTGLLPRGVNIPRWVHEGLATYFEAPGEATWAGIGAVNPLRLEWYMGLEPDRLHSNIKFIVRDEIFDFARSHAAVVHGYGQAWALTHFLMETRIQDFVRYYRRLGEMPPDVTLNPNVLEELFSSVFGNDYTTLDQDWRSFMRGLQTDMERLAPKLIEDTEGKKRR